MQGEAAQRQRLPWMITIRSEGLLSPAHRLCIERRTAGCCRRAGFAGLVGALFWCTPRFAELAPLAQQIIGLRCIGYLESLKFFSASLGARYVTFGPAAVAAGRLSHPDPGRAQTCRRPPPQRPTLIRSATRVVPPNCHSPTVCSGSCAPADRCAIDHPFGVTNGHASMVLGTGGLGHGCPLQSPYNFLVPCPWCVILLHAFRGGPCIISCISHNTKSRLRPNGAWIGASRLGPATVATLVSPAFHDL